MKKNNIVLAPTVFIAFNIFCTNPLQGPSNSVPYFINQGATDTSYSGYNVLCSRKFDFAVDTQKFSITKIKVDSTFYYDGSKNVWQYTYKYDTTLELGLHYVEIDSQRSFGKTTFSFFDSENDSCDLAIALRDGQNHTDIKPDSLWGDVAVKPGMNKTIYFSYHGKYDYSMISVSITLKQILDGKTVSTIIPFQNRRSLGDTDLVTTDSLILLKLAGKWLPRLRFINYAANRKWKGGVSKSLEWYQIIADTAIARTDSSITRKSNLSYTGGWRLEGDGGTFTLVNDTTLIRQRTVGYIYDDQELIVYQRNLL